MTSKIGSPNYALENGRPDKQRGYGPRPWRRTAQRGLLAAIRIRLATLLGLLLFAPVVLCQTHCRDGEIDYLSCETVGNGKVLSICGNVTDGKISGESWVQYRFGRLGHVELTYPSKKAGSAAKFEGVYFRRYGAVSLRFINGKTLYDVNFAEGYEDEATHEQTQPSAGVMIAFSKIRHVNIPCRTVDVQRYFGAFSELAPSLGAGDSETDILFRFYNEVAE